MRRRKDMTGMLFIALVLGTLFAAVGRGQIAHAVDIGSKDRIGSYLVDAQGMTLYTFKKDSHGKSTCTGECAAMWPPFYSRNITLHSGLSVSDFGAIKRKDGKRQVTYKGMPLYYFTDDRKPGDTNGNGVYNLWYPATP
jgi:predicted lipoprotein with Yx(FWY)xxD motif